jgi:predicted nucleic acid-binding protein
MAWYFVDEGSAYIENARQRVAAGGAVVPSFWRYEVENAVLNGEKRQRNTAMDSSGFFRFLAMLPIEVDGAAPALGQLYGLARVQHLSVYDVAFTEIASRRGLQLATTDEAMRAAAKSAGIQLL